MSRDLARLPDAELRSLATALRSGRLAFPLTTIALQRFVANQFCENAFSGIQPLCALGMNAAQVAGVLDLLANDRANHALPNGVVDLVTSGPDGVGANRDTGVVVRELFTTATTSVLVAGYAVYQGQHVFRALAERMQAVPTLKVTMFLDIQRAVGDSTLPTACVRRFADRFQRQHWPADHALPDLFYDPRSLDLAQEKRACLHAKCVVVDSQKVFVSSANFTEAAQLRNIEIGVLLESQAVANQITAFFMGLVGQGLLLPVQN